jgi:hypothetical protein
VVALVLRTGVWGIPGAVAEIWASLTSLDGEWVIRVAAVVLAAIIALAAIGRDRLQGLVTVLRPRAEREEQWREQEALDRYLAQMQEWLEDENRPLLKSRPADQRRKLARTQTLTVLKKLGPNGKRDVLEFLWEQALIKNSSFIIHPIVRLAGADLSNAHLANIDLYGANLDGINLSGADLSGARLCWFIPHENNPNLHWPVDTTRLSRADLSCTVLRGTTLAGCPLVGADFNGAVLDGADLRRADLSQTHNLTQEQINQAYGTYQQNRVPDTKLPNHLKAPPAWRKPIHEQKRERGDL